VGITHFEDAREIAFELGHLRGRWTRLGRAAGSSGVGVTRIQVPSGGWSTPAHEHGRGEEIFYVLAGRGLSWQDGRTAEISAGDCIVHLARRGAHTVHALDDLDLLAFGSNHADESPGFPRLGLSLTGTRATESLPYLVDGVPIQYARESELGPPELAAEPGPRPATIVNLDDVEPRRTDRPRVSRTRRDLGDAVGSLTTGLGHVQVDPGRYSAAQHCHSLEEEIFVVLDASTRARTRSRSAVSA
jgi:uncharacterized cupin superfamily protein